MAGKLKWALRGVRWLVLVVVVLLVATAGFLYWQLSGSLAKLEGEVTHSDLTGAVLVERDAQGIPRLSGNNREDLAFALGYLHAQERFFQMDLLRRNSAGELSELFGDVALDYDRTIRRHQFRQRGEAAVEAMPDEQRQVLTHYVTGVNHGIDSLRTAPFEYSLLATEPAPWTSTDTMLALYSMYLDLQPNWNQQENSRVVMRELLPDDWFAFLKPEGGEWDAPIDGEPIAFTADIPDTPLAELALGDTSEDQYAYGDGIDIGSNSWSVGGDLTGHGGAMVANDMHLGLSVPNIWYRATWAVPGQNRFVSGATLPGAPAMVVGTNEHIAWSFTNSNGDYHDTVLLQTRNDDTEYLTPDGWEPVTHTTETIEVRGGDTEQTTVRSTRWGPIIGRDHKNRLMAMRWVAHDPEGANLNMMDLERADRVDEALPIAARSGVPGQNFVVVDRHGDQAWTIMGRLPERTAGFDGREPQDWSDGTYGWTGYRAAEDYPVVRAEPVERLWTANARMVSGDRLAQVGSANYALGARQQQIRDGLLRQDQFEETDFLALQLDDEAVFLDRWQQLLADVLADATDEALVALSVEVMNWSGHADKDDVGYRVVKRFRETVINHTIGGIYRSLRQQAGPVFAPSHINNFVEYPVWALVTERPEQHIPPGFSDWEAFLQQAARSTLNQVTADGEPLAEQTWGKANTLAIHHPMADNIPWVGRFLNMPAEPMSGDTFMPRVQGPAVGASQRMVVAPGQEEQGIFHMATGQSGHPLSSFYDRGHGDWVDGHASPLLPGEPEYQLHFSPE